MKLTALVDGSSYAASVCDHAAWAADRIGADIVLLHVLGRRESTSVPADLSGNLNLGARTTLLEDLAKADVERARLSHARGRLILDDATARLTAGTPRQVEARLRRDDLLSAVAECEKDSLMLVVGKRGEASSFAHEHLGSNLERILRSATIPVLVANRAFQPVNRYLIAFDGSQSVINSVNRIAAGKLLTGLKCTILHVGPEESGMRDRMEGAAAMLRPNAGEVSIEFREGDPEETITAAVESAADLLVMGAYGNRRLRRLFIGSLSATLAHKCKVPVMIFR